jgi:uncharacterized membrane protein (Fun14 family)
MGSINKGEKSMPIEINSFLGSGAFGCLIGFLIGYAVKKILRLAAIVTGLFLGGITYFQYQGIINVNWEKIDIAYKHTLSNLATAAATTQFPGLADHNSAATIAITDFGFPLTGGIAVGFAFGLFKRIVKKH